MKMNRFALALAAATACLGAASAGNLGFPKPGAEAAKTLRADFRTPPPGYGEVPFWWWSGREPLNKERLLEQIEEIHKAGIAGVQVNYSHYRSGAWPMLPALFGDHGPDTVKVRLVRRQFAVVPIFRLHRPPVFSLSLASLSARLIGSGNLWYPPALGNEVRQ